MRWGVFSDVHANLEALEAVVARLKERGVERLLCLGDIVGYGASPNECVERVRQVADAVLAGNHDWAVAGRTSTEYFNTMAREAVKWTRRVLTPENLDYLKERPLVHRFGGAGGSGGGVFLAVHAAPCSPEDWEYILGTEDAVAQFRCFTERACLVGHSHQPFAAEISPEGRVTLGSLDRRELAPERRYIFNVGSVGQPRDADPRAAAAILDDGDGTGPVTLALERVPYDFTRTQEKILAAGLPAPLASRLGVGY